MTLTFPNIVGTIEVYMDTMRAICGDTTGKSMVDIGACTAPNTPKLGFLHREYFDVVDRILDHPEEQKYFRKIDILDMQPVFPKYDVVIASDVIEHIHNNNIQKFISVMEALANKQIIFTPIGEIFPLHNTSVDDPEAHHSIWYPDMLPGWATIVFPDYHRAWNNHGAFFAFRCEDIENDFKRVSEILNNASKQWIQS